MVPLHGMCMVGDCGDVSTSSSSSSTHDESRLFVPIFSMYVKENLVLQNGNAHISHPSCFRPTANTIHLKWEQKKKDNSEISI